MYNTTTIPTQQLDGSFLQFFYVLSMGAIVGASMIELFLFRIRDRLRNKGGAYIDDDSEEEAEEDYCNNYQDEFAALSLRKLSEEELKQLNTKIVREQVAEEVEVIMTFDKATETFWYYTDKLKEVSYPILETVARKFTIENDCKIIYLRTQAEQAQAEQAQAEQAPTPMQALSDAMSLVLSEEPEKAEAPTQAPSVFAKFKSYNAGKGSAPNFTSVVEVIEQMNHFRYRGKIVDYEERAKEKVEEPTLDYASYKKLLEDKKEN
jgi:hypothetical protein